MDTENMPPFLAFGELTYDLNEVDHRYYLRDHRIVGCITLMCTRPMDMEHPGKALLDGEELPECYYYVMNQPQHGNPTSVCIPIRGIANEYDREYTLRLEHFKDVNGIELEPFEITLRTLPRQKVDKNYEEHDAVALQAAREGMVLLKNEGQVLPIAAEATLNLFGSGLTNYRISAIGAGRIKLRFARNLREAIQENSSFRMNEELDALYALAQNRIPDKDVLERAKALNDIAVIILTRGTGENLDNRPTSGEYYLTEQEEEMIAAITDIFDKTVVVLNTGYAIDMRWTKKYGIKAILYSGLAGQSSADVLCEILDGRTNPSGKSPDTWAWDYNDIPSSVNFLEAYKNGKVVTGDEAIWAETCYEEDIYIGYRYFESFDKEAAFCFGHGLSYTDFMIESTTPVFDGEDVVINAVVTNIGNAAGREVVQVYVKLPGTLQEQPSRQLAAFAKTKTLVPGESETLELRINKKRRATYVVAQSAWMLEEGDVEYFAGNSVKNAALCGTLPQEERVLQKITYHLPCPINFEPLSQGKKVWPTGKHTRFIPEANQLTNARQRVFEELKPCEHKKLENPITFSQLKEDPDLLDDFVSQMGTGELTRLNMMYTQEWTMESNGVAGKLAPIEKYKFPDYSCADGNSSVLIKQPNIGMPTSTVVCASFNVNLAQSVARVIAEEARENGIKMLLAPGMNIHRNPLGGRNTEYFSEDPYLVGMMAAAHIKGLHEAGVSDSTKHIACNNCETVRKRNHSLVGERALREIYLRSFETILDNVQLDTIMTGYNALNGSMCGSDPELIDGIFREELGFDGFAITDWGSYETIDMIDAVRAGISWLTPGEADGSLVAELDQAVEEGRLSRAVLERNAKRVFTVMLRRF